MKKDRFYNCFRISSVVLIFLFTIIISCRKKDVMQPVVIQPSADTITQVTDTAGTKATAAARTYLALGDSYTIGQSVDSSDRFPAQTAALLAKQDIPFAPIQYIATTGWTTLNLMDAINVQQPKGPFEAVSLLIGVNDQYQTHDTTNYRSRFTDLLNKAIALAGNRRTHVFVLSIPDYGITPFGNNEKEISDQINEFNAINKDVTISQGISYTDVTTISRNDAGDASMIAYDGLHPSGKQYAQWALALDSMMYEKLK